MEKIVGGDQWRRDLRSQDLAIRTERSDVTLSEWLRQLGEKYMDVNSTGPFTVVTAAGIRDVSRRNGWPLCNRFAVQTFAHRFAVQKLCTSSVLFFLKKNRRSEVLKNLLNLTSLSSITQKTSKILTGFQQKLPTLGDSNRDLVLDRSGLELIH